MADRFDRYEFHRADLIKGGFMKYSTGNYADRNNRLVKLAKGSEFSTIVEVAGAEADLVDRMFKEFPFITSYLWSDLVSEAVENANERIINYRFTAAQLDLDHESPPIADLFISTALEHTVNYREVVKELPQGTLVLLSLPNFDGQGHTIYFPQFTDVLDVYGDILSFLKVEVFFYDKGIKDTLITLVKKCLGRMGLLKWLRKIGLFNSGCGRDSYFYKWLVLARRNGDLHDAYTPDL